MNLDHIAPGDLPSKRAALYSDAWSAMRCSQSAAEWQASVASDPMLRVAAEAVGAACMRAIVAKVWVTP